MMMMMGDGNELGCGDEERPVLHRPLEVVCSQPQQKVTLVERGAI